MTQQLHECIDCQAPISQKAKRCKDCRRKAQTAQNRIAVMRGVCQDCKGACRTNAKRCKECASKSRMSVCGDCGAFCSAGSPRCIDCDRASRRPPEARAPDPYGAAIRARSSLKRIVQHVASGHFSHMQVADRVRRVGESHRLGDPLGTQREIEYLVACCIVWHGELEDELQRTGEKPYVPFPAPRRIRPGNRVQFECQECGSPRSADVSKYRGQCLEGYLEIKPVCASCAQKRRAAA